MLLNLNQFNTGRRKKKILVYLAFLGQFNGNLFKCFRELAYCVDARSYFQNIYRKVKKEENIMRCRVQFVSAPKNQNKCFSLFSLFYTRLH